MKRWLIIGIILVVIIIGFFSFRNKQTTKPSLETTVHKGTIKETLTLSGKIDAKEKVTLRFQTAGKIVTVNVQEGDAVKKNQEIAALDQRSLQNSLQQLLNTYMNSRWSLDQSKSDNQTTADSGASQIIRERAKRIIDQSQFSLNNTVLAVEAQSLALEFAHLRTPIAGIVTRVASPLPGINISVPTQAEFDVVNPSTMYFEALADQTEVTQLHTSQTTQINLDSYPDTTISGTISMIAFSPKTDEVGTVYPVEIAIPLDNVANYRLGMTGDVTFVTQEKQNVLMIPSKFVKSDQGTLSVTVMENGKKVKREVSTGLENDTEIEITSGLSEGDVVYD